MQPGCKLRKSIATCRAQRGVINIQVKATQGAAVDATQQNLLVLTAILGVAGFGAVFVAILSSRSLREKGLKGLVKRWLGH